MAQSPDNNSNNKTNTIRNVKNLKIRYNNISNDERNSIIRKQRRRRSNSFMVDTVDNILNKLVEKYSQIIIQMMMIIATITIIMIIIIIIIISPVNQHTIAQMKNGLLFHSYILLH